MLPPYNPSLNHNLNQSLNPSIPYTNPRPPLLTSPPESHTLSLDTTTTPPRKRPRHLHPRQFGHNPHRAHPAPGHGHGFSTPHIAWITIGAVAAATVACFIIVSALIHIYNRLRGPIGLPRPVERRELVGLPPPGFGEAQVDGSADAVADDEDREDDGRDIEVASAVPAEEGGEVSVVEGLARGREDSMESTPVGEAVPPGSNREGGEGKGAGGNSSDGQRREEERARETRERVVRRGDGLVLENEFESARNGNRFAEALRIFTFRLRQHGDQLAY
ncbi:MAG: hypothetical protein Q9166_005281 [cf. Caloplaca sp. 2 TL-2023]